MPMFAIIYIVLIVIMMDASREKSFAREAQGVECSKELWIPLELVCPSRTANAAMMDWGSRTANAALIPLAQWSECGNEPCIPVEMMHRALLQ